MTSALRRLLAAALLVVLWVIVCAAIATLFTGCLPLPPAPAGISTPLFTTTVISPVVILVLIAKVGR